MTGEQVLTLAGTVNTMVSAGKIAVEDLLAFLESKGADLEQLQKNRALLITDEAAIDGELKADGQ